MGPEGPGLTLGPEWVGAEFDERLPPCAERRFEEFALDVVGADIKKYTISEVGPVR